MFEPHLARWRLEPDGEPVVTRTSRLLPVRRDGARLMLKIATDAEERAGSLLMVWWDGDGAARVLAHEGDALLLERARGRRSLAAMARRGDDTAADRILCRTAARLHAPRSYPWPTLVPLDRWFAPLKPAAAHHGGMLARAAAAAGELLRDPREVVPLHGDLHHDNVLDFGRRGWRAIDPKGLAGERTFDFVNLLRNPLDVSAAPDRLARRAATIAAEAELEPCRLLRWTLAFAGLSAAWMIEDSEARDELAHDLAVLRGASAALEA